MKKIIIIGANNFQLPLIVKAKEMGLETHVFAWEDGAVGKEYADYFYPISITEKDVILKYSEKIKPDGVLSIGSDLAAITVNYIAEKLGLVGNSLECTQYSTNKYLMREKLHSDGLPCPKFIKSNNLEEILSYQKQYPLIVKPVDRSGSRGVTKVNNETELENAVKRAGSESFSSDVIIEEFIEGNEYSVEMISWEGQHYFLQVTEKETTGAPYYIEKSHHQPGNLSAKLVYEVINVVQKSLDCLGIKYGASHSEIMITPSNDIYIIEIGARMGGDYIGSHLVKFSTGYDFLEKTINIALGEFSPVIKSEQSYSGIYYIIPESGKLKKVINNCGKYEDIVLSEVYYKIGDEIKDARESNDRAACFIYKSKNKKFLFHNNILKLLVN